MLSKKTYVWKKLSHPTQYPVKEGNVVVIPANSVGVSIAYRQSSKPLLDKARRPTGVKQNAYLWHGHVYNA